MHTLTLVAIALLAWQTLWCVVAFWKKRNDVADLAWGLGIAGAMTLGWWIDPTPRGALVAILTAVWGLRLALHIATRIARTEEDARYRAWRAAWGRTAWWRTALQVFLLQGALQWVVALPATGRGVAPLGWAEAVGVGGFLLGLLIEAVADAQLARFLRTRKDPEAVLDHGLWALSRHPNYFGEALLWWGIGLVAFGGGGVWWVLVSPLTVTILVRFVSGVPLAEARSMRKAAFRRYAERVPIFFPSLRLRR